MTGPGGGSRLVLGVAGLASWVAAAAALLLGGYDVPPGAVAPRLVLNLAVGWSFIGVGLLAWSAAAGRVLMVLLGFAWRAPHHRRRSPSSL